MKKTNTMGLRAAMMLLAMLCGLTGTRAEEVTVGDENSNDYSDVLPMYSLYDYSYTQQIYTSEEIGTAGTITSLTLWLMGNQNLPEMTFDIYMVETDKASFTDDWGWLQVTDDDLVYSGTVTVSNTDFQAYTFTLDTPFDYSGQGNIMIAFYNRTGQWKTGLRGKVFSSENNSLYAKRDSNPYDPTNITVGGGRIAKKNVVTFDITASTSISNVTIGNPDTDKYSPYHPISFSGKYSFSQQIYTAEEVGTAGNITAVTVWLKGYSTLPPVTFDIYMKETDKLDFYTNNQNDEDFVPITAGNKVCSVVELDVSDNQWKAYTFKLNHPFTYSGKDNLLIAFNNLTGVKNGSGIKAKSYHTGLVRTVSKYTDDMIDISNLPKIYTWSTDNIVIGLSMMAIPPTSLEAEVSYNSATLSWSGGSGTYNVEYKVKGAKEWTKATNTAINTTSCTISSLTESTDYEARVQSVGIGGAVSKWTNISFTTPYRYPAPTDLTCTNVTATTATITWSKGSASSWVVNVYDNYLNLVKNITVNNPTTVLTGLTEEEPYYVKVRDNRVSNGREIWTVPILIQPTAKWVIGYGEKTEELPINSILTEQIYTVAELGGAATIESIDFCYTPSEYMWDGQEYIASRSKIKIPDVTHALEIYMVRTSKSSFSSANDFVGFLESDLVFSGEVTFNRCSWTTIPLDAPFEYDGQSNVVLIVYDISNTSTSTYPFRVFDAPGQALNYRDDVVLDVKNQIRLVKSAYPLVPKPKNFTLSSLSPRAARVKWTGKADSYDVRYGEIPQYAWLQYDNGTNCNSVYTDKTMEAKSRTWGVMYPGDMVTGNKLAKVSIYESYSYNNNTITMEIYAGGDNAPDGKPIYTQDIVTEARNGFHEVKLNQDVYITPGQNLWITLTQYGTAVGQCSCLDEPEPNSQWVYANGTWQQYSQLYPEYSNYGFMIRAAMEGVKTFPTAWTNETSTDDKEYYMSSLSFDTSYLVQVRSKKWIDGNAEYSDWATLTFTTPSIYDDPHDLYLTDVTQTSAKLNWTGYQNYYDIDLYTYKQVNSSKFKQVGKDVNPTTDMSEYTFDLSQYSGKTGAIAIRHYNSGNGTLIVDHVRLTDANGTELFAEDFETAIPSTWITMDPPGRKGWGWFLSNYYEQNSSGKGAHSASGSGYSNWLIIPNVQLGGTLTLYASYYISEKSRSTVRMEKLGQVFGVFVATESDYILDESEQTITPVYTSYHTFDDLEPGATYKVKVKGHLNFGYDTDWSDAILITTQSFTLGDVNGDGSVTPADAIMILYHYFNVVQNGFIEAAADVNGDGNISPADAIEALYIYFGAGSGKTRETEPAPVSAPEPE